MTEKLMCPHCCAQVEFDVSRHQWICCGTGEPVLWIPQQRFDQKIIEAILKALRQVEPEIEDSPITPTLRVRADEIKALREEYNLSFDDAVCLVKSSRLF